MKLERPSQCYHGMKVRGSIGSRDIPSGVIHIGDSVDPCAVTVMQSVQLGACQPVMTEAYLIGALDTEEDAFGSAAGEVRLETVDEPAEPKQEEACTAGEYVVYPTSIHIRSRNGPKESFTVCLQEPSEPGAKVGVRIVHSPLNPAQLEAALVATREMIRRYEEATR